MISEAIKCAYTARRRMPSPNVLMRIPLLKPVPAVTPISFHNQAKPDPSKTTTPGLNLTKSPIIKDIETMHAQTQKNQAQQQAMQDKQFSEATRTAVEMASKKTQQNRAILQREREALSKEREAITKAKAETVPSENPQTKSFLSSLDAMRKSWNKSATAFGPVEDPKQNEFRSAMDNLNKPSPMSWLGGASHPVVPPNANFFQNLVYGPTGRGLMNTLIGTGVSPAFQREMMPTGTYSAGDYPSSAQGDASLQALLQSALGSRAY